ncbi:hypothetical protein BH09PSE5_BH09PSE5_41260 [soil metagenome]
MSRRKSGEKRLSAPLSNALTTANVIGTLLVVAIHYTSRERAGDNPSWNYLFQEFLCNGLSRVAVPFFAFASGLFLALQYAKSMPYTEAVGRRIPTILVPYLLAALFFMAFLHGSVALAGLSTPADPATLFNQLFIRPFSFQFWFLRDLILLIVLSPLLIHRNASISWVGACVLVVAWAIDFQPFPQVQGWYFLNIETLCFFWLGGAFAHRIKVLEKLVRSSDATMWTALSIWIALSAARVAVDPYFNNWYARDYSSASLLIYKFSILSGLVALLLLAAKAAEATTARLLALQTLTFFVFLFHEYPLRYVMLRLMGRFVPSEWTFYIAFPLALLILIALGKSMQRHLPRLYNLLTGGRSAREPAPAARVSGLAIK